MKALLLVVFVVLVVTQVMQHRHRGSQRSPAEAEAWRNWFSGHPNGGGV